MTERQIFEIDEMRIKIFERDGFKCKWCNGSIYKYHRPQLAHGISKSKANLKKYGSKIIHSEHNLKSACCLYCNSMLAVGKANENMEAERIKQKYKEFK